MSFYSVNFTVQTIHGLSQRKRTRPARSGSEAVSNLMANRYYSGRIWSIDRVEKKAQKPRQETRCENCGQKILCERCGG